MNEKEKKISCSENRWVFVSLESVEWINNSVKFAFLGGKIEKRVYEDFWWVWNYDKVCIKFHEKLVKKWSFPISSFCTCIVRECKCSFHVSEFDYWIETAQLFFVFVFAFFSFVCAFPVKRQISVSSWFVAIKKLTNERAKERKN